MIASFPPNFLVTTKPPHWFGQQHLPLLLISCDFGGAVSHKDRYVTEVCSRIYVYCRDGGATFTFYLNFFVEVHNLKSQIFLKVYNANIAVPYLISPICFWLYKGNHF